MAPLVPGSPFISTGESAALSLSINTIALGGVAAIYAHFTQVMDLELNLPLQYASITIIAITLVFFLKAQLLGPKGQN